MHSSAGLPLAARAADLVGSVIDSSTSLLASQTHDIVRFAMGAPAPEAIPTEVLAGIGAETIGAGAHAAFDYAATEGDPGLRAALVEELAGTTDATTLGRLTITSGGMQGLDLACKLFVDPGDLVVVESPTYTNGSATALSYQADLLEVPVDDDGLRVDLLEELVRRAGRTPKVVYAIPTFQNPSGASMSLERRRRLLELARSWGSVVIDDDPYGMLRFEGEPLPTLHELAAGDPLVFSVRTFSKIVAPGLRVGWVDTAPELQPLLINAKQAMDTCTNHPLQRLLSRFLEDGHLGAHLETQRAEYGRRKRAMQQALEAHFSGRARWTDPQGGFSSGSPSTRPSTPRPSSRSRSRRASRSSPATPSRRANGSPMRCGSASPRRPRSASRRVWRASPEPSSAWVHCGQELTAMPASVESCR